MQGEIVVSVPTTYGPRNSFMKGVVQGCKAGLSLSYVKQKWTDFGAGWKWRPGNQKILSGSVYYVRILSLPSHSTSVGEAKSPYQYIEAELKERFNLSTERRQLHFMTVPHFIVLVKHKWQKDWHQYTHPRSLVQNHAACTLFVYTPSRVGEIFESSMRRGSGRGLLYRVRI